jgi:copper chaperone
MMQTTLKVEGMTCGHCKAAVEGALKELNGVSDVKVSLDTGKADVTYEKDQVAEKDMRDAVEEQGYDVE